MWIGLVRPAGAKDVCRVRATAMRFVDDRGGSAEGLPDPDPLGSANPLAVPPTFVAEGVARGDGTWWALAREAPAPGAPACRAVELEVSHEGADTALASVHVDLVDADQFHALTGVSLAPLPGRGRIRRLAAAVAAG